MKKRLLAVFLSVIMVIGMLPTVALAADESLSGSVYVKATALTAGNDYVITGQAQAFDTEAALWTLTETSTDGSYYISTVIEGKTYYLYVSGSGGSRTLTTTAADSTTNRGTFAAVRGGTTSARTYTLNSNSRYITSSGISSSSTSLVLYDASGTRASAAQGSLEGSYYITDGSGNALKLTKTSTETTFSSATFSTDKKVTKTYAMKSDLSAIEVTPEDDILASADSSTVWTASTGVKLKSGSNYLRYNSGLTTTTTQSNGSNWSTNGRNLTTSSSGTRYVSTNGKTFSASSTNSANITLYEKTEFDATAKDITAAYTGNVILPEIIGETAGLTVKYSIDNATWMTAEEIASAPTGFPVNVSDSGAHIYVALFSGDNKIASTASYVTVNITAKSVDVPEAATLEWTGSEQTGVSETDYYSVSGDTKGTDKGDYNATLTLKNSNYAWADGTVGAAHAYIWHIAAKSVEVPAPKMVVKTGSELTGIESNSIYTVGDTGSKGTDAGQYITTLTLTNTESAVWADGADEDSDGTIDYAWYIVEEEDASLSGSVATYASTPENGQTCIITAQQTVPDTGATLWYFAPSSSNNAQGKVFTKLADGNYYYLAVSGGKLTTVSGTSEQTGARKTTDLAPTGATTFTLNVSNASTGAATLKTTSGDNYVNADGSVTSTSATIYLRNIIGDVYTTGYGDAIQNNEQKAFYFTNATDPTAALKLKSDGKSFETVEFDTTKTKTATYGMPIDPDEIALPLTVVDGSVTNKANAAEWLFTGNNSSFTLTLIQNGEQVSSKKVTSEQGNGYHNWRLTTGNGTSWQFVEASGTAGKNAIKVAGTGTNLNGITFNKHNSNRFGFGSTQNTEAYCSVSVYSLSAMDTDIANISVEEDGSVKLPAVTTPVKTAGNEFKADIKYSMDGETWYTPGEARVAKDGDDFIFPVAANDEAYTVYVGLFYDVGLLNSVAAEVEIKNNGFTDSDVSWDEDVEWDTENEGEFIYDGTAKEPAVIVKIGDTELTEDTDYEVSYNSNVNAAASDAESNAPTVTITGIGGYDGCEVTKTFTILPKALTITAEDKTIYVGESEPTYTYTVTGLVGDDTKESVITTAPGYTVEDDSSAEIQDTNTAGDYTITPKDAETTNTNYTIETYTPGTLTIKESGELTYPSVLSDVDDYDSENEDLKIGMTVTLDLDGGAFSSEDDTALTTDGWTKGDNKYTLEITADEDIDITDYIPTKEGYVFNGWSCDADEDITLTAQWIDDTNGDGTPDKYQVTVTFKIVNGTWDGDDDTADKTVVLTLTKDSKWDAEDGTATLAAADIPTGMTANTGYGNGTWGESAPDTTTEIGADGATYTYTYYRSTTPINPDFQTVGYLVKHYKYDTSTSQYVEVEDDEELVVGTVGATVTATPKTYEGFCVNPQAEGCTASATLTAIEEESDIVVLKLYYDVDENEDGIPDDYQVNVTFSIVDGTWDDESTDDVTVYVTLFDDQGNWSKSGVGYLEDDQIPEPVVPEGLNGRWFPDPYTTAITADTDFIYSFSTVVAYYTNGGVISWVDSAIHEEPNCWCDTNTYNSTALKISEEMYPGGKSIHKEGYSFAGWYSDQELTKSWNFDTKVTESIALYAKWVDNLYEVTVYVSDGAAPVADAAVILKSGEEVKAEAVDNEDGTYTFANVPEGNYNIVVEKNDNVMTAAVSVTEDTDVDVLLPVAAISIKIEEHGDTRDTSVDLTGLVEGNLPQEGEDKVELVMDVENVDAQNAPDGTEPNLAFEAIDPLTGYQTVEYMDISLTRHAFTDAVETSTTPIHDTEDELLAITIQFPTNGRNIYVYRYHDEELDGQDPVAGDIKLTQIASIADKADGTFIVGNNCITIFSKYFSIYAIGYEDDTPIITPIYIPYYSVITPETSLDGQLKISRSSASSGTTIRITVTPDEGYELNSLTVTRKNGDIVTLKDEGNGVYSFTMPSCNVYVNVAFAKLACPCDDSCPIDPFTDTENDLWWHDGIHYCLENELMVGMPGYKFQPYGTLTRAQVVMILWRMEGCPVANYAMSFKDVESNAWYAEAIRWAQSTGIVKGYDAETFGPNDVVTREQLATILYRYAQNKGEGFTGEWYFLLDFNDRAEVSSWADEAVHWCSMEGVVKGKDNQIFDPQGSATRAEAACMIQRFCEIILDK